MAYDVTTTPTVGNATKRSDYVRLRDAVKAVSQRTFFLGGDLQAFFTDTAFIDHPNGFEVEVDFTNMSGLSAYLEVNGACQTTSAVTATVKAQYWDGAAWQDVSGASVALALTTAFARVRGKTLFTVPVLGVVPVKFVLMGSVGAANPVAGAAWLSIRG